MKNILKLGIIILLLQFIFASSYAQTPWKQHRNNPQNTGYTSSITPEIPVIEKQITLNGRIYAQPVVDSQGNIFAASQNDTLYAFNSNLEILWKQKLGILDWNWGSINSYPALSPDEATVYLFDWEDGKLNAFRTNDGSLKWKSEEFIKDYGWGIPMVASNGDIILVHGNIICISPDGATKWRLSNEQYHHWATFSLDESTIYVGSYNKLFVIDVSIGAAQYIQFETFWAPYPVAVDNSGNLYSGRSRLLRSIAMPGANLNWSIGYSFGDAEKIGVDNNRAKVYMAINDTLYSYNFSGTLNWKKKVENAFFDNSTAPVIDGNGFIYVANWNLQLGRGIIKFDWQTGNEITELIAVGSPITTFPVIANGKIYAGLNTGLVVWGDNPVNVNEKNLNLTFELSQNFPNPFNPTTNINYSLPENCFVNLSIYDVLGRKIVDLINQYQVAGQYTQQFKGESLPSGIYLARLTAGNNFKTIKMNLIK